MDEETRALIEFKCSFTRIVIRCYLNPDGPLVVAFLYADPELVEVVPTGRLPVSAPFLVGHKGLQLGLRNRTRRGENGILLSLSERDYSHQGPQIVLQSGKRAGRSVTKGSTCKGSLVIVLYIETDESLYNVYIV